MRDAATSAGDGAVSPRAALREQIERRLLPALRERGFSGPSRLGRGLVTEFARADGEQRHILSVQFEKRGLPRFVLLLTIEPPGGFAALTARGGEAPSGVLRPGRSPSSRGWFRADPSLVQRLRGRRIDPADAVSRCLALLPEADAWWRRPADSAHVRTHIAVFQGHSRVSP